MLFHRVNGLAWERQGLLGLLCGCCCVCVGGCGGIHLGTFWHRTQWLPDLREGAAWVGTHWGRGVIPDAKAPPPQKSASAQTLGFPYRYGSGELRRRHLSDWGSASGRPLLCLLPSMASCLAPPLLLLLLLGEWLPPPRDL